MKKQLFLLLCAMMCLFLVLCSCGDDEENPDSGSSQGSYSSNFSQGNGMSGSSTGNDDEINDENNENENHENLEISSPETPCKLSSLGHYWSDVSINKNTSASGTVAISGKCDLCGDSLYKVYTALVDYNEWKNAISESGLSSFTEVVGKEYTDYSKNGSLSWRFDDNGTYTADYFVNISENSSTAYSQKFQGFSLQYNDFKYDNVSKTYVYWINEKSYVELGFADGKLLSHSTCTVSNDDTRKTTTLYLNHGRVTVECPDFIVNKFNNSFSLSSLKQSNLGSSLAEGIYNELSRLSFNGSLEASLLKNDEVSIYFYLDKAGSCPISGENYFTASVVINDGTLSYVSFGSTSIEISYK